MKNLIKEYWLLFLIFGLGLMSGLNYFGAELKQTVYQDDGYYTILSIDNIYLTHSNKLGKDVARVTFSTRDTGEKARGFVDEEKMKKFTGNKMDYTFQMDVVSKKQEAKYPINVRDFEDNPYTYFIVDIGFQFNRRKGCEKYAKEQDKVYTKIRKMIISELDSTVTYNLAELKKLIDRKKAENEELLSGDQAKLQNRRLNSVYSRIKGELNLATSYRKQVNKYKVEIYKKFSIPTACIIFILIGAPMGVITKKGGIAVPALLSLLFFLLYYIFLVGGEELADMLIIPPFWAMWTPNILLLIVGVYLTYYATWEHRALQFSRLKKLFKREHKKPLE